MTKNKLLFIVEDETDMTIVETLARRLVPQNVQFYIVPLMHKSGFMTAYVTAFKFLTRSYHHIIVVFDSDSADELEIENRYRRYLAQFVKYGLTRDVELVAAVPQIETWLLGHYIEHPELEADPKAKLADMMQADGVDDLSQLAENADLDVMKKRSASFAQFVQTLQSVVAQPVLPPLVYTVGMPIPV